MKIVKRLITLAILIIIGFFIYQVFFNCDSYNISVDQQFTLKLYDYAKLNDGTIIKLLRVKDNRCYEENCEYEGEAEYKLLVMNDMRINIVTISTLVKTKMKVKKTDYTVNWISSTKDDATFKITEKVRKEDK